MLFFSLFLLQRNFSPLRLRHRTSQPSSAIYGAPPLQGTYLG